MDSAERGAILADELLIVRNSGEIPEIALHGSLYYLQQDEHGPRLALTHEELDSLRDAALERYQEIVIRDLVPENRDLSIYRGIRRTIFNWHRLQSFCQRIGRDCSGFGSDVAHRLRSFLRQEVSDVRSGCRTSCVNCTVAELEGFCRCLGIDPGKLPTGWRELCLDSRGMACGSE